MRPLPSLPPPTPEPAPLVDPRLVRDWARFVLSSLRRRLMIGVTTFLAVLAAAILGLWGMPRSYHVETRMLAQPNHVMPALANPHRTVPRDADAPTRGAQETVMRRDNLVSLVRQTSLIEEWSATRAPFERAKDFLMRLVRPELTEEDKIDAMVGLLEKRLWVNALDGNITIGIDWPNARMAYLLVGTAQQNFLEARHAAEISTIAETISLLESRAGAADEAVRTAETSMSSKERGGVAAEPSNLAAARRRGASEPDRDLEQLRMLVAAKTRAIEDLEQFRHRRIMELQATLTEQSAVYSPAHPVILDLQQSLRSLAKPSQQFETLLKEREELAEDVRLREAAANRTTAQTAADAPLVAVRAEVEKPAEAPRTGDSSPLHEEAGLKLAIRKYEEVLDRLDAARIELDLARAAFKHRYMVIRPAQVPKKAQAPNVPLSVGGAVVGGVLLALFITTGAELRAGRINAAWQLERQLSLPVLAQVKDP